MKKSHIIIIISTLLIGALLFAITLPNNNSKIYLKSSREMNYSSFSNLGSSSNNDKIYENNTKSNVRRNHHLLCRSSSLDTKAYPEELTGKIKTGRIIGSRWNHSETTTTTCSLHSKKKKNELYENFSYNLATVPYFRTINSSDKTDAAIGLSNSLAYNQTMSRPQLALGGGTEGDEDPLNPGGGTDNEEAYNDVPIGDALMITSLFIVLYFLFVFSKTKTLKKTFIS